jgi:hypothetical protein
MDKQFEKAQKQLNELKEDTNKIKENTKKGLNKENNTIHERGI